VEQSACRQGALDQVEGEYEGILEAVFLPANLPRTCLDCNTCCPRNPLYFFNGLQGLTLERPLGPTGSE